MSATPVLNGFDMRGTSITNLPDAVAAQEPATKAQLDAAIRGLAWKTEARLATTGNIVLSGLQSIDGITTLANDRVLVWKQANAAENGIYSAQAGAWVRTVDADNGVELSGATVLILLGTTLSGGVYTCNTPDPIVVGTNPITFIQSSGKSLYVGASGITVTGNTIGVDPAVVARKVGVDIGDGSALSFNIAHNLGSTDVVVLIREIGGSKQHVVADIVFTSVNVVTVVFASPPTSGQYRVSVVG